MTVMQIPNETSQIDSEFEMPLKCHCCLKKFQFPELKFAKQKGIVWDFFYSVNYFQMKVKMLVYFEGGKTLFSHLFHFYLEDVEYLIVKQPNH